MNTQCPVDHGFEPFSATFLRNPFPMFENLRRIGPVAFVPKLDAYVVSRYDDVVRILKDREAFLSADSTGPFMPICPEAAAILARGFPRKRTFTNADPPRHTQMRDAAMQCLTKKRWAAAQPGIRAYAEKLIDAVAEKSIADLREEVAFPLPAFAGFSLLGFPLEDTALLKSWCGRRVALTYGDLDPAGQIESATSLVEFWAYVRSFVERRMTESRDDLTTDLITFSRQKPEVLTIEDVTNMIYSISLAAHETTTAGLLNCLRALLSDRTQWDALRANPNLIPHAIEECFRLDSPTLALRRRTSRAVEVDGTVIPEGAMVFVLLASANRDEKHYIDPDRLDVTRSNATDQLAFGRFYHFCLGAPLARFEIKVVLELLLARMPEMRLLGEQSFEYTPNILIHAPERLLVAPNIDRRG
jgi:cytochrome P450